MARALVVLAILATMLPLATSPRDAYACSCAPFTRGEKIERSEVVLEGKVDRLVSGPGESQRWQITVRRIDKGQLPASFILYDWGGSCSVQLAVGAAYFMALTRDPHGDLRIADCSLREWLSSDDTPASQQNGDDPDTPTDDGDGNGNGSDGGDDTVGSGAPGDGSPGSEDEGVTSDPDSNVDADPVNVSIVVLASLVAAGAVAFVAERR